MGTASVSFARGQRLTRSRAPWWALPMTLSHEAKPAPLSLATQPEEQADVSVSLPQLATRLPLRSTFHQHPGIHLRQCTAKLSYINKASITITKSISSYLCTVAQTGVEIGWELRHKLL